MARLAISPIRDPAVLAITAPLTLTRVSAIQSPALRTGARTLLLFALPDHGTPGCRDGRAVCREAGELIVAASLR
jgi:hypothetical protein